MEEMPSGREGGGGGAGDEGRKKPAWLRWLMLVAALGLCWTIWDEVAELFRLEQAGMFSPELWEQIRAEADVYITDYRQMKEIEE